jgi:hypothetical protein
MCQRPQRFSFRSRKFSRIELISRIVSGVPARCCHARHPPSPYLSRSLWSTQAPADAARARCARRRAFNAARFAARLSCVRFTVQRRHQLWSPHLNFGFGRNSDAGSHWRHRVQILRCCHPGLPSPRPPNPPCRPSIAAAMLWADVDARVQVVMAEIPLRTRDYQPPAAGTRHAACLHDSFPRLPKVPMAPPVVKTGNTHRGVKWRLADRDD